MLAFILCLKSNWGWLLLQFILRVVWMSSTQKCSILPNVSLKHTNVNLLKAWEGKSMVNIFCGILLATMILDKSNGGPTGQPIMSIGKQTIHLSKAPALTLERKGRVLGNGQNLSPQLLSALSCTIHIQLILCAAHFEVTLLWLTVVLSNNNQGYSGGERKRRHGWSGGCLLFAAKTRVLSIRFR